ncbi:hypothetical protein BJ684DRAFT_10759 [Piptocephalis cylindrospora]|uniref:Uncharacterized protein n=1 Tax=Piptocephalis cylindrospora TaxID=1907219 RepID=A0A4P9Y2G0_9FUNG|nr:hypothetical protein BJ684DRAFT_10759 [Piptocephalis cylindrospora]|eukprot:RKP12963.1 hypothetical protein BJ684DRAFT_10759 [Piptocephalis cylindrospora]
MREQDPRVSTVTPPRPDPLDPQDPPLPTDTAIEEEEETEEWSRSSRRAGELDVARDTGAAIDDADQSALNNFTQALRAASGLGKTKSRMTRADLAETPEVLALLARANAHYVAGRESEAIQLLKHVIRTDPAVARAWLTLAMIYDTRGDADSAAIMRFCAADNARDPDLWCDLAQEMLDRDNIPRAIHCYSRAIGIRKNDVGILRARTQLYAQQGRILPLLGGYQMILRLCPQDKDLLSHFVDLAMAHSQHHKIIDVYSHFMDMSLPPEGPKEPYVFGWHEVNILAELLISQEKFASALHIIKVGVRRLQRRGQDPSWDAVPGDLEYDVLSGSGHPLPLDLRVKVIVCRLHAGEASIAKMHLNHIMQADMQGSETAFHAAGQACLSSGLAETAMEIFQGLSRLDPRLNWARLTDYFPGMKRPLPCFLTVMIQRYPEDLEAKERLAKVYEALGRKDDAIRVLFDVSTARLKLKTDESMQKFLRDERRKVEGARGSARPRKRRMGSDISRDQPGRSGDLFTEDPRGRVMYQNRNSQFYLRARMEARQRVESESQRIAQGNFKVLDLIGEKPPEDLTQEELAQLIHTYRELLEDFCQESPYFSLVRMRLLQDVGAERGKVAANRERKRQALELFRGKGVDVWFHLFLRSASLLHRVGQYEEAMDVLRQAEKCYAFDRDPDRFMSLQLVISAMALDAQDYERVFDVMRKVFSRLRPDDRAYRLYILLLGTVGRSRPDLIGAFASSRAHKFFRRETRRMDKDVEDRQRAGQPAQSSPALLSLYGHVSGCARTYRSSIAYYLRATTIQPADPIVHLSLGISYLSRALQRTTADRQTEVLWGFSYINRYVEARSAEGSSQRPGRKGVWAQETHYNLARAFHHLGLVQLAIPHYEKVLALPSAWSDSNSMGDDEGEDPTDLSFEAAYNLSLIHQNSGSPLLAASILDKYCIV